MQFDLLSDLHVEDWPEQNQIDWQGIGTSLVAVVAGDVSRDLDLVYKNVLEISKHYRHVVYVDGNHEHDDRDGINQRREEINDMFKRYQNVTYLYRNTIILDNTAFIGCNGWYTYDFCEPFVHRNSCLEWLIEQGKDQDLLFEQYEMAMEDSHHINNCLDICNRDPQIKNIVIVTHAVPRKDLAITIPGLPHETLGVQGSSFLQDCLAKDVNNKVGAWVFGHVHAEIDAQLGSCRFVSNPRGTPHNLVKRHVYYPKRITV
jgi:hypothetical protein